MSAPEAVVLHGDAYDLVPTLEPGSVHCILTSPPYWGLREYGVPPRVWGGDPAHAHEWGELVKPAANGTAYGETRDRPEGGSLNAMSATRKATRSGRCACGAWRGVLGLEPDYGMYVAHLADLFDALARVLRPDGVAWLVIGDCYATGAGLVGDCPGGGEQGSRWAGTDGRGVRGQALDRQAGNGDGKRAGIGPMTQPNRLPQPGLKPKDLVMIPARVALELQARGWWLRSFLVWDKPNPMPESVRDRPTLSHEHVLLLARSERYFYDWYAIAEPSESGPSDLRKMAEGKDRYGGKTLAANEERYKANALTNIGKKRGVGEPGLRNCRSVWRMATVPYSGPHFATFPPELVTRCIRAGTPDGGVCAECGRPAERILGDSIPTAGRGSGIADRKLADGGDGRLNTHVGRAVPWDQTVRETIGWRRPCGHAGPLVPATVLDPFGGTGTTAATAVGIGRRSIYIDANAEYVEQARQRIGPLLIAEPAP